MAAGYSHPSVPSIEEHQAHVAETKRQAATIREKNKAMREQMQQLGRLSGFHNEAVFWARHDLKDLDDRAQFLRIATISNPSAIGQYAPNLKGPEPYQFYREQVEKVRAVSVGQLALEAKHSGLDISMKAFSSMSTSAPSSPSAARKRKGPIGVAGFVPLSETESSGRKLPETIRLGLRMTPTKAPKLPALLPRDSENHPFKEHTAAWLARSGEASPGRNREHISSLTRVQSEPGRLALGS